MKFKLTGAWTVRTEVLLFCFAFISCAWILIQIFEFPSNDGPPFLGYLLSINGDFELSKIIFLKTFFIILALSFVSCCVLRFKMMKDEKNSGKELNENQRLDRLSAPPYFLLIWCAVLIVFFMFFMRFPFECVIIILIAITSIKLVSADESKSSEFKEVE